MDELRWLYCTSSNTLTQLIKPFRNLTLHSSHSARGLQASSDQDLHTPSLTQNQNQNHHLFLGYHHSRWLTFQTTRLEKTRDIWTCAARNHKTRKPNQYLPSQASLYHCWCLEITLDPTHSKLLENKSVSQHKFSLKRETQSEWDESKVKILWIRRKKLRFKSGTGAWFYTFSTSVYDDDDELDESKKDSVSILVDEWTKLH